MEERRRSLAWDAQRVAAIHAAAAPEFPLSQRHAGVGRVPFPEL